MPEFYYDESGRLRVRQSKKEDFKEISRDEIEEMPKKERIKLARKFWEL